MAIITGGASGIGAASVRLFVENGARVVVADMQTGRGEALSRELSPNAVFQQTNVTHEEDVRAMVACAESAFGRIDCIFNNARFGGALGESPKRRRRSGTRLLTYWCAASFSA